MSYGDEDATRTTLAVAAVTALALVTRLVGLGARVAHQDEARVAYWAYRYLESGVYWYRPIVHGPFLAVVDSHVFSLLGASDFSMRLVVALAGGLLPLAALLFRHRLRDGETIGLAVVLAANPILLYYSRFYRNDLVLAGFMLVALGFLLRASDHRRVRDLYFGMAFFAAAFTTKENAFAYPVFWLGAAALLFDRRLLMGRVRSLDFETTDLRAAATTRARRAADWLRAWWYHAVLLVVEFLVIVVFFYAPRGTAGTGPAVEPGPTLSATLADPTKLPALVGQATLGSWHAFVGKWASGANSSYLTAAGTLWKVLATAAAALVVLAVVGFLVDRYTGDRPRDLVAFAFYWGAASVLAYPILAENPFPWETINMVVPLAIPAAVGLALVVRVGRRGLAADRRATVAAAAIVLVVVAGFAGYTGYQTSVANPQGPNNDLVQYAQSSSEMKPLLHRIHRIARDNRGTDVVFYGDNPNISGDELAESNESVDDFAPAGAAWFNRLPFSWYLETDGARTASATDPAAVGRLVRGPNRPPVVIAFAKVPTCTKDYDNATQINGYMDGYEIHEVQRFQYDSGCTVSTMDIYIDTNATA